MKVSHEHSAQIRAVYQLTNVKGKALLAMFPQYKPATIYKHAKKPINGEPVFDKRTLNRGRPRKLTSKDERMAVRKLLKLRSTERTFCSPRIQLEAGLLHVSNRTVRRALRRHGYKYLRSRRKGMLLLRDLPKRRAWCRITKLLLKRMPRYFTDEVSMYVDGVGFEYKTNPMDQARAPKAREWRRDGEGLSFNCTAKGRKEGVRQAHFMVGISHKRGVVLCIPYDGQITGRMFADMVENHFEDAFRKCKHPHKKFFLMDGCPRQGAKIAKKAMKARSIYYTAVPARSPDLNCIENFFNLMKKKHRQDALDRQITYETFQEFRDRVMKLMLDYPTEHINSMIESMPKRVNMVLYKRGQRIKY